MMKLPLEKIPESISRGLKKGRLAFDVALSQPLDYYEIYIKCGELVEPKWKKKYFDDVRQYLEGVEDHGRPCLYYFEILSVDTKIILEKFREYKIRKPETKRSTPALKKKTTFRYYRFIRW